MWVAQHQSGQFCAIPQRYCDSCVCVPAVAQLRRLGSPSSSFSGHIKAWMGLVPSLCVTAVYRTFMLLLEWKILELLLSPFLHYCFLLHFSLPVTV